jgi:isoamylase
MSIRRRFPVLRRNRFLTGALQESFQLHELTWLTPTGENMTEENWKDPFAKCVGLIIDGRARASGVRRIGSDQTVLWIVNASHIVVKFTLPKATRGTRWRLVVDTNQPELDRETDFEFGSVFEVTDRSTLLFELRREGSWFG